MHVLAYGARASSLVCEAPLSRVDRQLLPDYNKHHVHISCICVYSEGREGMDSHGSLSRAPNDDGWVVQQQQPLPLPPIAGFAFEETGSFAT